MVVIPEIACSIMDAIGKLQPDDNFSDFKVFVGGHIFNCHRFILNACSGFFSALLRSGMKESVEGTATIYGMSSDIFAKILQCLYTGSDIMTMDNIFELWHASNLLQINFLVTRCEKFVLKNVVQNSYFEVYKEAKLLDSHLIVKATLELMIKDFETFSNTSHFVHLHVTDLLILIESDDLNISSEDVVVKAILKWVTCAQIDEGNDGMESWCESEGCGFEASAESIISDGEEISKAQRMIVNMKIKDEKDCFCNADSGTSQLGPNESLKTDVVTCNSEMKVRERNSTLNIECKTKLDVVSSIKLNLVSPSKLVPINQSDLKSDSLATSKQSTKVTSRSEYIGRLLATCRICLVSPDCIETMLSHDLVLESKEALAAVRQAVLYQLRSRTFWPASAVHRVTSKRENVVLFNEGTTLKVYSMSKNRTYSFLVLPEGTTDIVNITAVNNQIFVQASVGGVCTQLSTIFVNIFPKIWLPLLDKLINLNQLIAYGDFIYFLSGRLLRRMNYKCVRRGQTSLPSVCTLPYDLQDCITYAAAIGKKILIFWGHAAATSISVMCVDTKSFEVKVLEKVDGLIEQLVVFGDGENTYLLQLDGALHKIIDLPDSGVEFQFMTKLWGFDWHLIGAVVYKHQLFLFGSEPYQQRSWSESLPGYFHQIKVVFLRSTLQCLPAIIYKSWMFEE